MCGSPATAPVAYACARSRAISLSASVEACASWSMPRPCRVPCSRTFRWPMHQVSTLMLPRWRCGPAPCRAMSWWSGRSRPTPRLERSVPVVMADGLEHEAVRVEPEGGEIGRRVLGERAGVVQDGVALGSHHLMHLSH